MSKKILGITVVGFVFVALTVIGLAFHFSGDARSAQAAMSREEMPNEQIETRAGILKFFNADTGKVDEQAVKDMADRIPPYLYNQALSRADSKIETAVANGTITDMQATQLREALNKELR